jgi:uncharacterized protein
MPGTLHFCADVHLGKLARLLRMLGFDTVYKNNFSKDELLKIARDDSRCVLSKSPYFLKFPDITFYQIKSSDSYQQLEEVINHFHLQQPSFNPFSRCLYCNAILEKKEKTEVDICLLPQTKKHFTEFWQCPACKKIYWKGSQYERMMKEIEKLINNM